MQTAAAILVQTIVNNTESLRAELGAQAIQNPTAAADFLKPYYVAACTAIKKAEQENPQIR
jgi:hypothetical protein